MFEKFKATLKKSLSIFSRKANEEAEPIEEKIKEDANVPAKKEAPPAKEEKPAAKPAQKEEKPVSIPKVPPAEETPQVEVKPKPAPETKPLLKEVMKEEVKPAERPAAAVTPVPTPEPPNEQKGFLARAKELLTTRKLTEEKFEELFWDLELVLLENNVAVDVVHKMKGDLKKKLMDKPLPRNLDEVVEQALKESIEDILSLKPLDVVCQARGKKPFVITFFGINGSGKTTTIAKVAKLLQQNNLSCVMAAGDTFRAAAIQQLEEHANKLNVRLIKHDYGADAAAVVFDAIKFAQKNNIDVILIDTAGRLHSDANLMDELKKIVRVAKPDIKIFVGESMTGNDCIEQSQKFDEHIGIDAIILTKADVDEKGGTALSISYITKKPIIFIGTGQSYADLQPFTKELVLRNLGLTL